MILVARLVLPIVLMVVLLAPSAYSSVVTATYRSDANTTPLSSLPAAGTAMVFGAKVEADGQLSGALRSRLDTAIALYQAKRVGRLLMTGDGRASHHYEPAAMQAYAQRQGIPLAVISKDDAGYDTYASCRNAVRSLHLTSVWLVTQRYRLPRATLVCRQAGLAARGVAAQHHQTDWSLWALGREVLATDKAAVRSAVDSKNTIKALE